MTALRKFFTPRLKEDHPVKHVDDYDERFSELVSEYNSVVKDYESCTMLIDKYDEALQGLHDQNDLLLRMNADLAASFKALTVDDQHIVRDKGTNV